MNLHIKLDSTHPSYQWLEQEADRIGAKGHYGTHIDCYTKTPLKENHHLPAVIIDCTKSMPSIDSANQLPSLKGKALVLYTGNLYLNDYGSRAYFNETDTSISKEVLTMILSKEPCFILIDSYGIGNHGEDHINLDKQCEIADCFVIENICIAPSQLNKINNLHIRCNLEYPSTGKPCEVTFE